MKAPWIALFALLAACGLGAGAMRWMTLAHEVAKLQADNAKLAAEAAAARDKANTLEAASAQLQPPRALAGPRLEPGAMPAPAQESPPPKAQGGFLAKMLRSPEVRDIMAAQQATALRGIYGDFITDAHLTPDETGRFYKLLQDRQTALMDSSAQMMSGGPVDMNAATAATNAADDAIEDLLGPERYGQYREFENTLPERVQVRQLNQELAAEGAPLQDFQSRALIQILSEETASLPNIESQNGTAPDGSSMSPADSEEYALQVDAMNRRVYNRAASVLTPRQLSVLAIMQRNIATARTASMKMTGEMSPSP